MLLVSNLGGGRAARPLLYSGPSETKTTRTIWGFAVGFFRFPVPMRPQRQYVPHAADAGQVSRHAPGC